MAPEQRLAIERAIRDDEKMLVRWLAKKLGDIDDARDVAQNVFMRVWAFAETTPVENPRALMFKTAANLALNELKRRNRYNRRHVVPVADSDDNPVERVPANTPSPEHFASLRQDVSLTLAAINDLPERPRQAFMMNRFDGLSYREIAQALNVSESSVEKYMIEALKRLRAKLQSDDEPTGKVISFASRKTRRKTL